MTQRTIPKKPPPKSLFKNPEPIAIRGDTVEEKLRHLFSRETGQNYFKSAEQLLDANLMEIEAAANLAEQANIERGAEYADNLRDKVKELRSYLRDGDVVKATLCALLLGQSHMQMRSDAAFAKPVIDNWLRSRGVVNKSTRPTKEIISKAIKSNSSLKGAAQELECNSKTLYRWRKELGLLD